MITHIKYLSTRGQSPHVTFTQAVATGLAPDGGLYLPEQLPQISAETLATWAELDYTTLCQKFLALFATDIKASQFNSIVEASYKNFTHPDIAPLYQLEKKIYVQELFHGPTLAFKDFALQFLGNLYEAQIQRTKTPINVLGATSGDTGSAAIHGLLGKQGVKTFILYPEGRISELQERQMTCTGADNVYPIAIEGTFDDAQAIVKTLFNDLEFRNQHHLSAVNSINLARILAQCVYYLYAWFRIPEKQSRSLQFVVPTGNFGNVLAGWLLAQMGVPIHSFKVATNQNDILYKMITTGVYQVNTVQPSVAPSMDIQIASNFERFLYYKLNKDTQQLQSIMEILKTSGSYTFENWDADILRASRALDPEIIEIIRYVNDAYSYCIDPHTACGFKELDTRFTKVILATAHPAKFPDTIKEATGNLPNSDSLEALKQKTPVKYSLPNDPEAVRTFLKEHAILS